MGLAPSGLVRAVLTRPAAERERLRAQVRPLEQRQAAGEQLLTRAVVIDQDKQADGATAGPARGAT